MIDRFEIVGHDSARLDAEHLILNHPDKNAGVYLAFSHDQSRLVNAPIYENRA